MLNIYIARHGQNQDNAKGILNGHRDEPLTQKGVEQAHEVANKIRESKIVFDKIYSSPLKRAYETANIISDTIGVESPQKVDLLIERDFGIMTGKNISDIEMLCSPDIIKSEKVVYFLNPEGAETFPQLLERADNLIKFVNEENGDGSILLVTSGDIGKMIYAKYYKLDWKDVLTQFNFGNCDLLLLSEDSPSQNSHVFEFKQYNH